MDHEKGSIEARKLRMMEKRLLGIREVGVPAYGSSVFICKVVV